LIELGRERIAHITGPERFEAVAMRQDGYRRALGEAGISEPRGFYRSGVWSESWGRDAVAELFNSRRPPDAIFCGNDQIARGVADALRERDVRVPDDVAVVGFDNWEIIAAATRPPLTSIDMNLVELGRVAGTRALCLIAGAQLAGVDRIPCNLVIRESCGAKGSRGG
jgi:LacI family transcriptional regulator